MSRLLANARGDMVWTLSREGNKFFIGWKSTEIYRQASTSFFCQLSAMSILQVKQRRPLSVTCNANLVSCARLQSKRWTKWENSCKLLQCSSIIKTSSFILPTFTLCNILYNIPSYYYFSPHEFTLRDCNSKKIILFLVY